MKICKSSKKYLLVKTIYNEKQNVYVEKKDGK